MFETGTFARCSELHTSWSVNFQGFSVSPQERGDYTDVQRIQPRMGAKRRGSALSFTCGRVLYHRTVSPAPGVVFLKSLCFIFKSLKKFCNDF